MTSVPYLCRNRFEDVTDGSNTILLPVVVQLYGFPGKPERVDWEKALNHHEQESNKKDCVAKFTER